MPPATTSAQAQQNLQKYTSSMATPDQAYNTAAGQFGVNQAGQQVSGLRSAIQNTTNILNRVAPSVMGRVGNSLVTDAQATRQIANEQAPINTTLQQQNQDYANANQDYQTAEAKAQAMAANTLGEQRNQQSYLEQVYQDLASKEQEAAKLAETQREFNLTPHGSSGGSGLDLSGLGSLFGGASAGAAAMPTAFTKGTSNQDALKQLFTGYQPGADKGYTERVAIPTLAHLLTLNNPKQSQDVIKGAAQHLAYQYRKQNFGE